LHTSKEYQQERQWQTDSSNEARSL